MTTNALRDHLAELETKFHESSGSGAAALSRAIMQVRERLEKAEADSDSSVSEIDQLRGRRDMPTSQRRGAGSPRRSGASPRRGSS